MLYYAALQRPGAGYPGETQRFPTGNLLHPAIFGMLQSAN